MTDDNDPPDYEVGYGRPPVATRFQSGRSGNPRGRPKGSKSNQESFGKALRERVTVVENGRRRTITKRDAIAKQHVNKAVGGDARSAKFVLDQMIERGRGDAGPPLETPASIAAQKAKDMDLLAALRGRLLSSAKATDDDDS